MAGFGAHALIADLTPGQRAMLRHPLAKRVVLWCMFFMATRDMLLATCLAVVGSLLLEGLLNERSSFGVLKAVPQMALPLPAPLLNRPQQSQGQGSGGSP